MTMTVYQNLSRLPFSCLISWCAVFRTLDHFLILEHSVLYHALIICSSYPSSRNARSSACQKLSHSPGPSSYDMCPEKASLNSLLTIKLLRVLGALNIVYFLYTALKGCLQSCLMLQVCVSEIHEGPQTHLAHGMLQEYLLKEWIELCVGLSTQNIPEGMNYDCIRALLHDPEDREEKALDSGGIPVLTRESDRMGWKRRRWNFQGSFFFKKNRLFLITWLLSQAK